MKESDSTGPAPVTASEAGGPAQPQVDAGPPQPTGPPAGFNYGPPNYPNAYPMLPMRKAGRGPLNLITRLIALALFVVAGIALWFGNYGTYSEFRGAGMSGYSVSSRSGDRLPFVVISGLGAILVAFSFLSRWVAIAAAVIAVLGILMFVTYSSSSAYWAQHLSIYLYAFACVSALVSLRK